MPNGEYHDESKYLPQKDDDLTRLIAASDQLAEAMKITTPIIWEYFNSLVEKGFTREEALTLTLQLENRLFNGMTNEE